MSTSEALETLVVQLELDAESYSNELAVVEEDLTGAKAVMDEMIKQGVEQLTLGLESQAKVFGMTAREAEIYRYSLAGASEEQLASARAANAALNQLEKQQEEFQQGAALIRKYRSETDVFADTQKELGHLFRAGAIDMRTYKLAVEDAKKSLTTGWDRALAAITPVHSSMRQFGMELKNIGRSVSLYVTAPLVAAGGLAVNEFSKFDDAMTQSMSIMGDLSDEMKASLKETALSIENSIFAPNELAGAYYYLASAGLSAEASQAALVPVMEFATAGAFDLEKATELLGDSVAVMGLNSADAAEQQAAMVRTSDVLNTAAAASNASVEQFAQALTNGGADLKNFNMELETTVAALEAYASKGNKGVTAGSDLARAVKLTAGAYSGHKEIFQQYGIEVYNAAGQANNFIDIIEDMENAFAGLSDEERANALTLMGFETLAQGAILPLVGMSKQMKEWENANRSAAGFTKTVAARQMESFKNQITILYNEIKKAGIEIGAILVPYLKSLSTYVSGAVEWFRSLDESTKGWILTLGGVVAVIGPLIALIGSITAATTMWAAANAILQVTQGRQISIMANMSMLLTPMGLAFSAAAIGVGMLVAAHMELNGAIAESKRLMQEVSDQRAKQTQGLITESKAMKTREEREKFLQDQLKQATLNLGTHEAAVNASTTALREAEETWLGGWNGAITETTHNLEQNQKTLEDTKDRIAALQAELAEIQDPADQTDAQRNEAEKQRINELSEAVGALNKELDNQVASMGRTSAEAKIEQLAMQGATEEQLAYARAQAETLDIMQKEKKGEDMLQDLEAQKVAAQAALDTWGSSARAAQIYRMEMEEIPDDIVAVARAIDEEITALERQKKFQDQMQGFDQEKQKLKAQIAGYADGTRAAKIFQMELDGLSEEEKKQVKAIDAELTALEKQKSLMDEAKKTTEKYQDPQIAFTERQKELNEMLQAGYIDQTTYNNALKDAQAQMSKDYKIEFKSTGVDGVAADTAEALARLDQYRSAAGMVPVKVGGPGLPSTGLAASSVPSGPVGASGNPLAGGSVPSTNAGLPAGTLPPATNKQTDSARVVELLSEIAANTRNEKITIKAAGLS